MVDAQLPGNHEPENGTNLSLANSADRIDPIADSYFSPAMRIERATVLFNPISGRGAGQDTAIAAAAVLDSTGVTAQISETRLVYTENDLEQLFKNQDLVVVVGGDGSIMGCLGALAASGTPIYMIPGGNESLFAKYFGMSADPAKLLEAVRTGRVEDHFYGNINGEPFFLMVSAGFDSLVVEEIGKRTGPSSDWLYISAAIKVLPRFRAPEITLVVDGNTVVDNEPGYLIIANTPSYGRNLSLVPEASSTNPTLAARFFPRGGFGHELDKAFRMSLGLPADLRNSRFYAGSNFELSVSNGPFPIQADGDLIGSLSSSPTVIKASAAPIRVLRPA